MAETKEEVSVAGALASIWFRPGRTIAGLERSGRGTPAAYATAAVFGVLQAMSRLFVVEKAEVSLAWERFPGLAALGAAGGVVGLLFLAWLFRNVGRLFGGSGRLDGIRLGLGWGLMPLTVLWSAIAFLLIAGSGAMFEEAPQGMRLRPELAGVFQAVSLAFFVLFLYGYGVLLLSLAAAHRFTIFRSLLAVIVTGALTFFPVVMVVRWLGV